METDKIRIEARVPKEDVEWIDDKTETMRFGSRSHAVCEAIKLLRIVEERSSYQNVLRQLGSKSGQAKL